MKKNEKIFISILVVVAIIIIVMLVVKNNNKKQVEEQKPQNEVVEEFVSVLEDGTKLNTSSKLSEAK